MDEDEDDIPRVEDGPRVQALIDQATEQVGRVSDRDVRRDVLRWISQGRWGRVNPRRIRRLDTPWRDRPSSERIGWRERAAVLEGKVIFAVDYEVCRRCGLGWVEQPYTEPRYQRRGLATAGLAALRAEHPELRWHTLGGHLGDSRAFWDAVGATVPGGYRQQEVCAHISIGG